MIVVTTCIGALLNVSALLFHSEDFMVAYYVFPLVGVVMATINNLIILPFCYKFGVQGANSTSIAILFMVGAVVTYIQKGHGLDVIEIVGRLSLPMIVLILVVLIFILLIVSLNISIKIFEKENVK